jgi:hypothetical protein
MRNNKSENSRYQDLVHERHKGSQSISPFGQAARYCVPLCSLVPFVVNFFALGGNGILEDRRSHNQTGDLKGNFLEGLAERVGFEPTIPVKVCPLSRRIVSTTHAPLRMETVAGAQLPAADRFGSTAIGTKSRLLAAAPPNGNLTTMSLFRMGQNHRTIKLLRLSGIAARQQAIVSRPDVAERMPAASLHNVPPARPLALSCGGSVAGGSGPAGLNGPHRPLGHPLRKPGS